MGVQVTELTLNKNCHEKEFIDFEFDGKHISEFGMVAVADGDRHSFDAAPTFENETSSVNGVDGQYYWGTHFGSKKMTFSLATDGMTEAQINAFKLHFKPGKYGKFIEDKLACRKAYARVAQIVTFNMVPFRTKKTINETTFYINEYKGDCRITFEFDNPYFEATSNLVEDMNDEQSIRAIYINNTPWKRSWTKSTQCFIGDKTYLLKQGAAIDLNSNNSDLSKNEIIYYNPATAKTKAKIEVEFQPSFTEEFPVYFNNIFDDINNPDEPYSQILTSDSITMNEDNSEVKYPHELRFTNPDVIYSINKAIKMAVNYTGSTALEFEEQLRLEIVNPKVMGWAASALRTIKTKTDYYNSTTDNFLTGEINVDCSYIYLTDNPRSLNWKQYFNVYMLYMLAEWKVKVDEENKPMTVENPYDISELGLKWSFPSYTIVFDGEQNNTKIYYNYKQILDSLKNFSVEGESCGDMILSEYLNLDGGDTLTEEGNISTYHKLKITNKIQKMCLYYTPTYF